MGSMRQIWCWMLIMFALFCLNLSSTQAATSHTNCGKPIDPSRCRPDWGTKIDVCEDLIKRCRCQHNIALKWVHGGGCDGYPHRPSGCQCSNYCDIPCKEKCMRNGCKWKGKKCVNASGYGGQIGTCTPIPSGSPTLKPTKQPTFEPTPRPTFDPTMMQTLTPTVLPSRSPSTAPITNSPTTESPTTSPEYEPSDYPTSSPSTAPTRSPTTSTPTTSPEYESSEFPTSSPSAMSSQSPTFEPTRRPTVFGEYEYE